MFNVGDLIERITWDAHAKKLGVVVGIGEYSRDADDEPMIKVCWADNYGTFWAQPTKLKLIAKGKNPGDFSEAKEDGNLFS
jgi:hypothetical protein